MSLNESQQRAVAVALRQLEERLGRIEDIIERDESGALFTALDRGGLAMRPSVSAQSWPNCAP